MKVLHLYRVYFPENTTGIPRIVATLAEGLYRHHVATTVLATSQTGTGKAVRMLNHQAFLARRHLSIASTDASLHLPAMFRRLSHSADVIHYHFPWPVMDLLHVLHPPKRPSVVTYHSDVVRQRVVLPLYRPLKNQFLRRVDRIVATSPQYLETSPVLQRFRTKTVAIPLGIEDRSPSAPESVERWRRQLGSDFFLFVGSARYYKGLPFLIQAARLSGQPVVLVGHGTESACNDNRAPANVVALGELDDADRDALFTLCRALILPSHLRAEAFGVVLLEAARSGKPMITTEIGTGSSLVNLDNVTGLVVPPGEALALSDAMNRLASNQELASVLGANARRRFEDHFTAERMCLAYKSLYEQVVGEDQSTRR